MKYFKAISVISLCGLFFALGYLWAESQTTIGVPGNVSIMHPIPATHLDPPVIELPSDRYILLKPQNRDQLIALSRIAGESKGGINCIAVRQAEKRVLAVEFHNDNGRVKRVEIRDGVIHVMELKFRPDASLESEIRFHDGNKGIRQLFDSEGKPTKKESVEYHHGS